MRILICDDEPQVVEQLQNLIEDYFKSIHLTYPDLACFYDGNDLLADKGSKDILFLDVEMPGMDGIQAGSILKKENQNLIIFIVTSHFRYLDDAMRFHVFRYLNKPIQINRFARNMKEALELYSAVSCKLPIETKKGVYTLPASSVVAVEAGSKQVIVHTLEGNFISIHNIQYWVELLPAKRFFQTHRSFIVNFEHVQNFDHSLVYVSNCNTPVYLTRRKYTDFKTAYFMYLESTR